MARNYTGMTFGTLKVQGKSSRQDIRIQLKKDQDPYDRHIYWNCVCSACHRVYTVRSDNIRNGAKMCVCQYQESRR